MADTQIAYKGEITMALNYKATENSQVVRYDIEPERIAYVMIERMYENVYILPVIYVSINLSSDMYTKVVNTVNTSEFYLRLRKKDALSNTSIYQEEVNDTFSYVTSSTTANYSESLNTSVTEDSSYKNILIGLVSSSMTNELRQSFNGIYNNIDTEALVKNIALGGLKNIVMQDLKYNKKYDSIIIPPLTSRYKLLSYLYNKYAFYDSYFTFFMDFNKCYLISRNGIAVDGNDGKPTNVLVNIKDYTAQEAFIDGFTIKNRAYLVYVNASDTNIIVNNSTDKVTNNIIAYSDTTGTQDLSVTTNSNYNNTTKKTYVRADNGAAIKNELQSNSIMIELLKQNLDGDIFTPNKCYNVTNYKDYSMYDGTYYLYYKREFYYVNTGNEFLVTCNVGLKRTTTEEVARTSSDTYSADSIKHTKSSKKTSSSSKRANLKTVKATRRS